MFYLAKNMRCSYDNYYCVITKGKMSKNFNRVKKSILSEMESARSHDGESWAHIMLTNSQRLTSVEDQKAFWFWIMDPTDETDIDLNFDECAPKEDIPAIFNVPVEDDEKTQTIECHNEVSKNGLITYIHTRCSEIN